MTRLRVAGVHFQRAARLGPGGGSLPGSARWILRVLTSVTVRSGDNNEGIPLNMRYSEETQPHSDRFQLKCFLQVIILQWC